MTLGKNQEALDVFRTMYQMNTGDLKENYPVSSAHEEYDLLFNYCDFYIYYFPLNKKIYKKFKT